jgi:hypothetical protein
MLWRLFRPKGLQYISISSKEFAKLKFEQGDLISFIAMGSQSSLMKIK